MQPRIVRAVYDQQGNVVKQLRRRTSCAASFRERTAAELRAFLRRVVAARNRQSDRADSRATRRPGKPAPRRWSWTARYRAGYYAASFIGMVPYEHPRYVIYVKVERPIGAYYGSVVAAPAFAAIARAAMLHAGVLPSDAVARDGESKPHRSLRALLAPTARRHAGRSATRPATSPASRSIRARFGPARCSSRCAGEHNDGHATSMQAVAARRGRGRRRGGARRCTLPPGVAVVRVPRHAPRALGARRRILRRSVARARRHRRHRNERQDDDDAHDLRRFSTAPEYRAASSAPRRASSATRIVAARKHDAAAAGTARPAGADARRGAKAVAMEVSSHALALERVDDVRFRSRRC